MLHLRPALPGAAVFEIFDLRKTAICLAACFSFIFFLTALHATQLPTPPVTIATDDEKQGGALVELTTKVFNRMGRQVTVDYLPWTRVMRKGYAGEYDVILGAYFTSERSKHFVYSHPIGKVELVLAKRTEDDIQFTSLKDLKPYRIGYIRGAASNADFERAAGTFLHVEYVSYFEYNIRKLLAGRIDLLIDKKFMVEKTVRQKYPESIDKIEFLTPPIQSFAFHNIFPRNRAGHAKLHILFNQGLRQLQADGTMSAIYKRHKLEQGPDPLPGETPDERNFKSLEQKKQ